MAVTRNELRTDLRITGDNAVKAGLRGVGNAAENAGDDLRQMGKDAGYLERKLAELKATQLALTRQFNDTGDSELLKQINKLRREVRQYNRLSDELAAAGTQTGASFTSAFIESLNKPLLVAGALAAVGALLPGIGAMVAGAVSGVTGVGGIVGGIVAAAHDPRVKTGARELMATLGPEFKAAGDPLVAPLVEALGVLRTDGVAVAHDLREGFATLAPELVPLTRGLTGLVKEAMPGLLSAFESSRPVLRAMAAELPKIGHAVGEFFRITTQDSDAAVLGFTALSRVIQNVLIGGAKVIDLLGDMYKGMVVNSEAVTELGLRTTGWLAATGPAGTEWVKQLNDQHNLYQGLLDDMSKATSGAGDFSSGLLGMKTSAEQAADAIKEVAQAESDFFNQLMGLETAQVRFAKAQKDVRESLEEGRKTLDLNTESGIKHREALDSWLQGLEAVREEQIKNTGQTDEANKKYLEQIAVLEKFALKLGYSRAEVDAFLATWKQIPETKNIQLNLRAGGDAAAWAAFRNLERQQGGPSMGPMTVVGARAGGGPVMAGRGYIVGEHGPEFFSPGASGYVSSASQTAAMMSGGSGGSRRPVLSDSGRRTGDALKDVLMDALWPEFLKRVRVDGGDLGAFGAA